MSRSLQIFLVVIMSCYLLSSCLCQDILSTSNSDNERDLIEGRTFGHHFLKKISFAVIPAAFVIGVITTLLAALTVVSLKGLGVGVILLILSVGQLLAKNIPHAAAYVAPHNPPLVYSHHPSSPLWVDKDW